MIATHESVYGSVHLDDSIFGHVLQRDTFAYAVGDSGERAFTRARTLVDTNLVEKNKLPFSADSLFFPWDVEVVPIMAYRHDGNSFFADPVSGYTALRVAQDVHFSLRLGDELLAGPLDFFYTVDTRWTPNGIDTFRGRSVRLRTAGTFACAGDAEARALFTVVRSLNIRQFASDGGPVLQVVVLKVRISGTVETPGEDRA